MTYTVTVRHHGKKVFDVQCSMACLAETFALANKLYPTHKIIVSCQVYDDFMTPQSPEEEHIEESQNTLIRAIQPASFISLP